MGDIKERAAKVAREFLDTDEIRSAYPTAQAKLADCIARFAVAVAAEELESETDQAMGWASLQYRDGAAFYIVRKVCEKIRARAEELRRG